MSSSNMFETASAAAHCSAAAVAAAVYVEGIIAAVQLKGAIVAAVQAHGAVRGETARLARACAAHHKAGNSAAVIDAVNGARKVCNPGEFNSWLTGFKARMAEVGVGYSPKKGGTLWLIVAAAPVAPVAPEAPAGAGNGAPHGGKKGGDESAEARALRDRNIALSNRIRQLEAQLDGAEKLAASAEKRAASAEKRAASAENRAAAAAARASLAETLLIACAALEDTARPPVARAARGTKRAARLAA